MKNQLEKMEHRIQEKENKNLTKFFLTNFPIGLLAVSIISQVNASLGFL